MPLSNFEENLLFSTVRISITNDERGTGSIGTGFIVSAPLPGTEASGVFLISNRHVFGNPADSISLSFTKRKPNELKPDIGNVFSITQKNFTAGFTGHPNPQVDLACVNIPNFGTPDLGLYFRHYSEKNFSNLTEQNLIVGSEVMFIGYPDNRYDQINNVPIIRKGCIASAPKLDFNGKKQFLIDAQVFPGSSGSPVFAAINGEYKIVGVVAATMIKDQKIQTIPTGLNYGVQQVIGLGIVLKVDLVKDLIGAALKNLDPQRVI